MFANFVLMKLRISFALGLLILVATRSLAGTPCREQPCPEDSAAVVQALHAMAPWISTQVNLLQQASSPVELRRTAARLSERTDSLARRFREVFPAEDDDYMTGVVFNALAAGLDASCPGLAAAYRSVGTAMQFSDPDPYRPDPYRAVQAISERARSLARAKNDARIARLLEKLDSDRVDLIVAL